MLVSVETCNSVINQELCQNFMNMYVEYCSIILFFIFWENLADISEITYTFFAAHQQILGDGLVVKFAVWDVIFVLLHQGDRLAGGEGDDQDDEQRQHEQHKQAAHGRQHRRLDKE